MLRANDVSRPVELGVNPSQFDAVHVDTSATFAPERAWPIAERTTGNHPSPKSGPRKNTPCEARYWSLIAVPALGSSNDTVRVCACAGPADARSRRTTATQRA